MGFPGSSVSKESTCSGGDPGSIPGFLRSTGKRIGYPFYYSWASLLAQMVKNLPAMWEVWVRVLGWEDPLEEGMGTHSRILAWRIPLEREGWRALSMGSQRVRHDWATKNLFQTFLRHSEIGNNPLLHSWQFWSNQLFPKLVLFPPLLAVFVHWTI